MSKPLADRFKRARMAVGLKACEIAAVMGVSQGYVSQIESGKRQNISKDILLLAADRLGVTVDWLLSGSGPPPKENDSADWSGQASSAIKLIHEKIELQERIIESQRQTIESQKQTISALQQTIEEMRDTRCNSTGK